MRIVATSLAGVVALVAGLVWASTPYPADPGGLVAAQEDARLTVDDEAGVSDAEVHAQIAATIVDALEG